MSGAQTLDVFLNDVLVGEIREEPNAKTSFRFTPEYLDQVPRPVLSQSFLDDPTAAHEGKLHALPGFFSNLLPDPDGYLRGLIAQQLGIKRHYEFALLSALGEDLPGAVTVRPRSPLVLPAAIPGEPERTREKSEVRFSLAGVQIKFSMIRQGKGLTYPSGGRGGNVIVKLPDPDLPFVPENEYSMMRWAGACGIDVPEVELLPMEQVKGLPEGVARTSGFAYAIQRFDRTRANERLHIEDMAQVFGLPPEQKYDERHYQDIGRLLVALPDVAGFEQLYPDGVSARLSPAYDFVSTQVYERFRSDKFALKFGKVREYREMTMPVFHHFARKSGASPSEVERIVLDMVERVRDEWRTLRADLPMPEPFKDMIERHWEDVPLLRSQP